MRLEFNVLWVDDQPPQIQSLIDAMSISVREQGFVFVPHVVTSIGEAQTCLSESVFVDRIDLILVDYDLGASEHGDSVLGLVRDAIPYRDIVFYSADPTTNLRDLAHSQKVGGVFTATRGDLVEEFNGVFLSIMARVLDIDHCRGIVMGSTSDIDHVVARILIQAHEEAPKSRVDSTRKKIAAQIADKYVQLTRLNEMLDGDAVIEDLLNQRLIDSSNKLDILSKVLKWDDCLPFDEVTRLRFKKKTTDYRNVVVPKRNALGHQRLSPTPDGSVSESGSTSAQEMTQLRREILDFKEHYDELAKAFGIELE